MKKYLVITLITAISIVSFFVFRGCKSATFVLPTVTNDNDVWVLDSLHVWQNWQWRGENRNGKFMNETELLKVWAAEGPELLWHFEGLGDGHTSAAIANGNIYITGAHGGRLVLYVLDMAGTLRNVKEIGADWTRGYPGPRSSVLVNDGKLYIFNGFGVLFCLDERTLDEVWTKDLLNEFDGSNLFWGITENPLIVDDKIFMQPGGSVHNMVALNKHTGALIWSSKGEGTQSAYCSPIFIDGYAAPMVVTSTQRHLIAFNANTGEVIWSFPQLRNAPHHCHPNMPIYRDGMIFTASGYGAGAMLVRLIDNGRTVEQVWTSEADNQIGGAVIVGNNVYLSGHQRNFWYCVDLTNGETKYSV
ncbi:MAG: PQQ-binding-like beta-propeller repeat protein, partial [Bacteroidales bacterium]|nr:PQQ-binding-like beta-propeller repeat protein [Bacteroidales bacterium]